jgi:uncharacterized protein (TIRG00374 family)
MGKFKGMARYLIGLALAAFLIYQVVQRSGANLRQEFRDCDPSSLILAFFLYGLGIAAGAYRWARLLDVQGVFLSGWQAIRLSMIGVFFNVIGPGGVGGDAAKMVYVKERAGPRDAEAILSILVDRIVGLLGLFIVAISAVIVNWDFLQNAPPNISGMVGGVFACALAGYAAVGLALYHDRLLKVPHLNALANSLSRRLPQKLVEIIGKVGFALVLYRRHPGLIAKALGISVLIHCCTALAVFCISLSFHAAVLQLRTCFLAIQMANVISAIPIFPGGLGGRDVVLSMFFQAAGEGPKSGVIPTVLSMLVILWSLIGGVIFTFAGGKSSPARQKLQ